MSSSPAPRQDQTGKKSAEVLQSGSHISAAAEVDDIDAAVDDSEDLDEEFVQVQQTSSWTRRRQSLNSDTRLKDVLGFQFRPNVRPLTISDLESCVALENAAFSRRHAASREKVSN